MKRGLLMVLFNFLKSTHGRTFPFGFRTGTNGEHQSVSFSTGKITPSLSIFWISASTFGANGCETHRGVVKLYGTAFFI